MSNISLKGTKTNNGVGITRVKKCPICGKRFRLQPGSGRSVKHGTRYGWPTHQCGRHAEMKEKPQKRKQKGK